MDGGGENLSRKWEIEHTVMERQEKLEQEVETGTGRKKGVRDRIWGRTINTNDYVRSHMETSYCRSFLKRIHI